MQDDGKKVAAAPRNFFGFGDERKFSGMLTRVARDDVRDQVVPRKNDHGPA
jgi:hypothetical protein